MAKTINCEDTSDEEGWSYCGKRECVSCGVGDEKKASNDRAFSTGWAVVKEWQGPREKVEEGKRMVEGRQVRYGQRMGDYFVLDKLLGYLDEEGNERRHPSSPDGYQKYQNRYPDIDIAYRHDQDMSGERPPPYTWGGTPEKPEPATTREWLAQREMRAHQEKLRRENEENWRRRLKDKLGNGSD